MLPQFVIVPFDNTTGYEFGLNIPFAFGFALTQRDIFSINIGSGPHYITADIDRQAPGFIFSDNLNLICNALEASILVLFCLIVLITASILF